MQAEVDEMEADVKRLGEEEANLEASLPLAPRLTVMEAAAPPNCPTLDKKIKLAGGAFLGLFGLVFLGVAVGRVPRPPRLQIGRREPGAWACR